MPVHACITRAAPRGGDLTSVREQEPAQTAITRSARERQIQLRVGNETARAAQVVVGIHVARAQRTAFVTTNGPDAPCIHVLDDGEGLATVGLAPVGQEVERQRVRTAQRNIVLVL